MTLEPLVPLWKHQTEGVSRALACRDFGFLFDMGAGKTCATINTLRGRYAEASGLMRTLIIAPIVVVPNWKAEFKTHSKVPDSHIKILTGKGSKRVAVLKELSGPAVVVTNYESLTMKEVYSLLAKWRPEIVILDESQRVKNHKAIRTQRAIVLGDMAKHRYILSGTPILNNPMDIFAQYRFLDKGESFGTNFFQFRNHYFFDKNAGMPSQKYFPDWHPRPGAYAEFNRIIYRKAMRVLKKDCLDLPPLVKKTIFVPMSPTQAKNYEQMRKVFIAYLNDKACVAQLALTKALRLQQIVSGFFRVEDSDEVIPYKENPRLDALAELLETLTPAHKVIVWACFRENYGAITDRLTKLGIAHTCLVGGMTDKARQAAIDAFRQDETTRVIVANQSAGGVGINLIEASYSIYYSRNFSLEADLQSEARNYRGGSNIHEKITRIDLVCPETIDEIILSALARKEDMAQNILAFRERFV